MNNKIDFVVTWVDDKDPEWIKDKESFKTNPEINSTSKYRYKDWGMFKYWFRGVEKFAPWVNKVFLITYGHLPEWLNTNNPKLIIINHKDYIPNQFLPTFNSNVIELNIHRIKELSENFVLFNDDIYLINDTSEKDFFKKNIPCDTVALNVHCQQKSKIIQNICNNNVGIINEHFDFKSSIKKNLFKWFNIKNGKYILRTISLIGCPRFPGFYQHHSAMSYNKSTFVKIWEIEPEIFNETSKNKFRSKDDINHWLIKEWQIASGNFKNRSYKFSKTYYIGSQDLDKISKDILKCIKKKKVKCIGLNDGELTDDRYEDFIPKIIEAFEEILPEKSSFEK